VRAAGYPDLLPPLIAQLAVAAAPAAAAVLSPPGSPALADSPEPEDHEAKSARSTPEVEDEPAEEVPEALDETEAAAKAPKKAAKKGKGAALCPLLPWRQPARCLPCLPALREALTSTAPARLTTPQASPRP
jgi:hypothetical protein